MGYEQKTFFLETPQKLNFYLSKELNLPFSVIARMLDKGRVLLNGERVIQKGLPVTGKVEVLYHKPEPTGLNPLFINQDFAVYDKPSGVLVHPNGFDVGSTLIDDIRDRFGPLANLAHRIDRETSGLVMVTKNKKTEGEIKNLFRDREIKKVYLAFVKGNFEKSKLIDAAILPGRSNSWQSEDNRPKVLSTISRDGQKARTMFYPIKYFPELNGTLIEAHPITGRTHQIRIHLEYYGYPIFGDPFYGVGSDVSNAYLDKEMSQKERVELTGAKRLMLHAYKLEFSYKNRFLITANSDFYNISYLKQQLSTIAK